MLIEKMTWWEKGDRKDALKKMWKNGVTPETIATLMGTDKTDVLSVARSLGLANGIDPSKVGKLKLLELTSHTCRWPFGDDRAHTFCGLQVAEGLPYCEQHARDAYQAKGERRE